MLAWMLFAFLPGDEAPDFYAEVRPLIAVHCHKCHAGETAKGGLRLDSLAAALKGGNSGPAIVPGKAADSLLYQRLVTSVRKERMPAKAEALPEPERAILRRWIESGAAWPAPAEAAKSHWAFRPLGRPPVPSGPARTPLDAFVGQAHAARGVPVPPEAPRRTLLRRLALDLTGLPPTREEAAAFEQDPTPDAYERAVERLLASPAYGERWGRHWLDLARFAETTGYEGNLLRASAWRYRDYVVRAFNDDLPYDRFLLEQLAGDEIPGATDAQLVATGFLAHGRLDNNQEDRVVQRNDHLVDIVNATASVAFGVSFGCVQCHEHKWDPFTHEDYYRLMGFFVRGQVVNLGLQDPDAWAAWERTAPAELAPTRAYRELLLKKGAKALDAEDRKLVEELDKKIARMEKTRPEPPQTWGFYGPHTGPNKLRTFPIRGQYPMGWDVDLLKQARPRLLKRGDPHQPGPELDAGWPEVFGPTPPGTGAERPRSALARWLVRPDHPTVARVFVNFAWLRHFGRGLVETPLDFGLRGARPEHPGLLDWLAGDFIDGGWSVKRLHRRIVLSEAYRQASSGQGFPWSRAPVRLEAEVIRDSMLAASGELDRTLGGPSVQEEKRAKRTESFATEPELELTQVRRSLYYVQRRHELPEMQALFDGARAEESCARRHVSTTALQPLYLMNHPFVQSRAKAFAARVKGEADPARAAFETALGRAPSPEERDAVRDLSLESLVLVLFNTNEFAHVD